MGSDSLAIDMEGILGAIQTPAAPPPAAPAAAPAPAPVAPAGEKPLKPMFDYGPDWAKTFGG